MNGLAEKKIRFRNKVIAWKCFVDCYGSWGKAARHYKIKKHVLIRFVLDDLEKVLGKKLDWKKKRKVFKK